MSAQVRRLPQGKKIRARCSHFPRAQREGISRHQWEKSLQQTPLRRKICHPNIPNSQRHGADMAVSYAGRLFERLGPNSSRYKLQRQSWKIKHFGWLGLKRDRQPQAALQVEAKHFHKSALKTFTCSSHGSHHVLLDGLERSLLVDGSYGCMHARSERWGVGGKKKCRSLHFLSRVAWAIPVLPSPPLADAGRNELIPTPFTSRVHQLSDERWGKHNKFRLPELDCLQALNWRMNSGDLMDAECVPSSLETHIFCSAFKALSFWEPI